MANKKSYHTINNSVLISLGFLILFVTGPAQRFLIQICVSYRNQQILTCSMMFKKFDVN